MTWQISFGTIEEKSQWQTAIGFQHIQQRRPGPAFPVQQITGYSIAPLMKSYIK
jgi:hypothetical protein